MKLKVWVVQVGEQLPVSQGIRRLRTLSLCDALSNDGHNVTWWTTCFNHFHKEWYFDEDTLIDVNDNFRICAVKGIGYRTNFSLRRFVDHRILAWRFSRKIRKEPQPDVVVIATPAYDIAYYFAKYCVSRGVPYIIDARDKWPDSFADINSKILSKLFALTLVWERAMLCWALKNADVRLGISKSIKSWIETYTGNAPALKTEVLPLGFARPEAVLECSKRTQDLIGSCRGKKIVTFVGTFGKYHDPSIVLYAAEVFQDAPVEFIIAGDGEMAEKLREKSCGLTNVHMTGWLDMADIDYILKHSYLGICSTGKVVERDFFPNKVFLYWAYGLPIGSMFEGELRDVIREENVGFTADCPEQFISQLRNIIDDPALHKRQSRNATKIFNESYSQSVIYSTYLKLIIGLNSRDVR